MEEQQQVSAPAPQETSARQDTTAHPQSHLYDSNPFTSAWRGIRSLVTLNLRPLVGLVFFSLLMFILLGATLLAILLAIFAFGIKNSPGFDFSFLGSDLYGFVTSMSYGSIVATWVIGFVVCVAIITLLQVLQLRLTISSAKSTTVTFGALLKRSLHLIMPLVGLVVLLIGVVLAAAIVLAILAKILGFITIIVGLAGLIFAVYASFRLGFAAYSIVNEGLGPIAALKRSWALTNGHVIETIGSQATSWLTMAIPSLIVSALARATAGIPTVSMIFDLLDFLLIIGLLAIASMAVAERFAQLQALDAKQLTAPSLSPLNFVAIVLVFVVAPLLNALSPKTTSTTPSQNWYDNSSNYDSPNYPQDQTTPNDYQSPSNFY